MSTPKPSLTALITSRRHKNSKAAFYLSHALRLLIPGIVFRRQLPRILDSLACDYSTEQQTRILQRVQYYNRIDEPFNLDSDTQSLSDLSKTHNSVYYFDIQKVLRYFSPTRRFKRLFGDVTKIPEQPTFVKSRPIDGNNKNAVLLKLNTVRHYNFINDSLAYSDKKDMLVWRGNASRPHRQQMVQHYYLDPLCDIAQTNTPKDGVKPPWQKGTMTIAEQLQYKFILSIEGNDVATNLKWIMSSNSLCFMKKPIYETWFMEGQLLPGVHYVLLADDYSDLSEKIAYYQKHIDEAEQIIANAQAYVEQFKDTRQERLVSLMVVNKYFTMSR
jgi:hypothetical protein